MDIARTSRRGLFHERTAEAWLRDLLDEARRGTLPGMVRTGATFADAAAEYLRWIEHDRARKPSTGRTAKSPLSRSCGIRSERR
jgi:integrase